MDKSGTKYQVAGIRYEVSGIWYYRGVPPAVSEWYDSDVHDHHKLRVSHAGRNLAVDIFHLSEGFPSTERFGITAQMRRAAVSIPSNIAEGAGRDGGYFQQFLGYAAGSASELGTQLEIARELDFGNIESIDKALTETEAIRRMLWVLIDRERSGNT